VSSPPGSTLERVLQLPAGARVLFTGRAEGNMSSVAGDGFERGAQARESLREELGLGALARGYQVHAAYVRRVLDPPAQHALAASPRPPDADGQATALRGVGALVLAADCLPVALAGDGAVAAVHAGWRGLAAGVLGEGVRAVRELGREGDLIALIGPCAGPCCYEVGEEVHAAFGGAHRHGRNIDLRAIAREQLFAAGVGEVRDEGGCTICDERFFSHRREGQRAGRQAVVAWLS
jgi:YfiH family protein